MEQVLCLACHNSEPLICKPQKAPMPTLTAAGFGAEN